MKVPPCTLRDIFILAIVVVVVLDSWVQTIDCFFSLWVCIAPLITVRTRAREGSSRSRAIQLVQVLRLKCVDSSAYGLVFKSHQRAVTMPILFWESLPLSWPVTQSQVSHALLLGFLRWSMTLGESFIASFKLYVFLSAILFTLINLWVVPTKI